jgi:hypothetical protein
MKVITENTTTAGQCRGRGKQQSPAILPEVPENADRTRRKHRKACRNSKGRWEHTILCCVIVSNLNNLFIFKVDIGAFIFLPANTN